jgi:hypothetical protein
MIATLKKQARLHVENLDPRLLLAVYTVGPGQMYAALHEVPWDKIVGGDTVKVYWQANPYLDKIVLNNSGTKDKPIIITGVAGPNGQLPVISALGAIENPQAKFWSSQVSAQGIFTIAPIGYSNQVSWITIANFELKDALRENWFINSKGQKIWYNWGAAGVAIYHGTDITISNCYVHNNENGIFGKSEGWWAGDLRNITIKGNTFKNNGVPNRTITITRTLKASIRSTSSTSITRRRIGPLDAISRIGAAAPSSGTTGSKAACACSISWIRKTAHRRSCRIRSGARLMCTATFSSIR